MNNRLPAAALLIALAFSGAACGPAFRYDLEMTPRGDYLERRLGCRVERWGAEPRSPEEIARDREALEQEGRRLADIYGRLAFPDPDEALFAGEFAGQTPGEFGGAGFYSRLASPLGDFFAYAERFGAGDPAGELVRRFAAADRLADLLRDWFRAEAGGEPGFAGLETYLDLDLRRDLKNAAVYLWLGRIGGAFGEQAGEEWTVRLGLFLAERGYFTPEEAPGAVREILAAEDAGPCCRRLRAFLAGKMALAAGEPPPGALGFLADGGIAEIALGRFLAGREEYRALLRAEDGRERPAGEALRELFAEVHGLSGLRFPRSTLGVGLSLPALPFATNGEWDGCEGAVAWRFSLDRSGPLAELAYAFWSVPAADFQRRHFGRIVLEDRALADYAFWSRGLTANERREWDAFLDGLRPGAGLAEAVAGFRFAGEPAGGGAWAAQGRALLAAALRGG